MPTRTLAIMTALTLGVTGLLATAQDHNPPSPGTNPPAEAPTGRPGPGPGNQHPGNRPPRSPLEAALDANGDGIISAEEIANAPAALRQLDRDGDGKLTLVEYAPPHPPFAPDLHPAGFNPPGHRREYGPGGPAGMSRFGGNRFADGPGEPGFRQMAFNGGPVRFPGAPGRPPGGPEGEHFGAGGFPGRPHHPMDQPENLPGDRAPFPPRPNAFHGGPEMPAQGPGFGPERFDQPGPRSFGHPDLNFRDEAGRPGGYPPEMRPFHGQTHGAGRPPGDREPQTREEGRSDDFGAPPHAPRPSADGEGLPPQPSSDVPPPQN